MQLLQVIFLSVVDENCELFLCHQFLGYVNIFKCVSCADTKGWHIYYEREISSHC